MSQAKVDRYKKEKADRKKTMRKEKIMRNVKRCVAGVIALAIVGWFDIQHMICILPTRNVQLQK